MFLAFFPFFLTHTCTDITDQELVVPREDVVSKKLTIIAKYDDEQVNAVECGGSPPVFLETGTVHVFTMGRTCHP